MKIQLFIVAAIATAWVLPASAFTPASRARGSTVLNVLNYGAKPNDSYDDTPAIQRAINALPSTGGTVYIPAGTYRINANDSTTSSLKGLNLRSKMLLRMDSGTILKTIPNSGTRFYVLNIDTETDVEVAGGQIIGERYEHRDLRTSSDQKSEWGHGIMVRESDRVTIRNMIIKDNWGDGLSLSGDDIIIDDVLSSNNRRNGLTIGRSSNVRVYDSEFTKTNGTAPQYGIDIEPDAGSTAVSPRIENCYVHHNTKGGILVFKRATAPIIKNNTLSYNTFGIYVVDTANGSITGNTMSHNLYTGLIFKDQEGGSRYYSVSGNIYRNNATGVFGITNDTNPLTAVTGFKGNDYSVTRAHYKDESGNSSTQKVGTNYYAK